MSDGGYFCTCPAGYTGRSCQTYINPPNMACSSNPCFHGGSCTVYPGTTFYYCSCPNGYSGAQCQDGIGPSGGGCESSPCENGGTCLALDNTGVQNRPFSLCACAAGFAGKQCQLREVVVGGRIIYYTTERSTHGFNWYWSAVATDALTSIQGASGKNEASETVALQKAIIDLFKALVSATVLSADHPSVREAMARFRPVHFSDIIVHETLNVGADVA